MVSSSEGSIPRLGHGEDEAASRSRDYVELPGDGLADKQQGRTREQNLGHGFSLKFYVHGRYAG
jgi:hypothetical protein